MNIREAVVKRIENLCSEKDITFNSLAYASGISPSTIKNILNGNSKNPGISTIKILCDGFDITIKEFFNSELFDNLEQEII